MTQALPLKVDSWRKVIIGWSTTSRRRVGRSNDAEFHEAFGGGPDRLLAGMKRGTSSASALASGQLEAGLAADAFAVHGRIDVLVNNAGYSLLGPIEETEDRAVHDLFEVNVFAPLRLIRSALLRFRDQASGNIINLASIASVAPSLGAGAYGATKAALSAMSYSLTAEVDPWGLWVSVVSPGAFRTEFLGKDSIRRTGGRRAYREVDDALARWAANDGKAVV